MKNNFVLFILPVPVQTKKKRNAEEEEEDETYEPDSQSDTENEASHEDEEEEEEGNNEEYLVSDDEEEVPTTVKSLKDVATKRAKTPVKRKSSSNQKNTPKKAKITAENEKSEKKGSESVGKKNEKKKDVVVKKKKTPAEIEEEEKTDETKKNVKVVEYNDKNVDFNLYNESPEHIKQLKVKLSSNIVMQSRMIEATAGANAQGLSYDYAALSFQRQTKAGKAYEFNLPLNLAPTIVRGINFIVKNNPTFFEKFVLISPKQKSSEQQE